MQKIKINFGQSDEISKLYGIGKILAERIIEFREAKGFYRGPDDLAIVSGISEEIAFRLSTQIDWELPAQSQSQLKRFLLRIRNKSKNETAEWIIWVNERLPNPEHQKALKKALEKLYSPSKLRNIATSIFLFLIGFIGWALDKIIELLLNWIGQQIFAQIPPLIR